jgi:diacylglycerol kinase (ATP)
MRTRALFESFNFAIQGIVYVLKTQRNMRLHFLIGITALLLGVYLELKKAEMVLLSGTVAIVLIAEMFNTALEHVVDMVSKSFHPLAGIVKDITAGAVLVAAVNALVVGYILFFDKLSPQIAGGITRIRHSSAHITFIILGVVLMAVIIIKFMMHSGTPFRGGMPSGHSAVAFSFCTIIALLSASMLLSFLAFVLAIMIAQSRIERQVHTIAEVAAGAALGILVTIGVFQLVGR